MLLQLKDIQKRFGGVTALRRGNLDVKAGEVHLLMGENGAGKSTLMKIVAGMLERDGGDVLWQGANVHFRNPVEAASRGIAMVHQETLLAPHLSVAENIFLGREPRLPLGWVNRREMMERASRIIEQHRFPLKPEWRVEKLSPAGKQMVEICRAIQQGSSLLIFDEPTSSLSDAETQEVFRIVRALRERQVGVIYITHRLEELRAIGDRVTVLRDGETVHSGPLSEITTDQLIRHMVGREVASIYTRDAVAPGEEVLRVEHLTREPVLKDVSFSLRAGEIVGMAGLIGAGRTELCRALFGVDAIDSGAVHIRGKALRIRSPRDAVASGLALIPEDRQHTGLATALPIGHNFTMANLGSVSRFGFLNHAAEKKVADEFTQRLRIRASSWKQVAGRLSGGNQQKVAIAKWLVCAARIFLFDEPTRGIDVGAKIEVFQMMDELARAGAAILMVSSELGELLQVADRILVMRQGRISGELPGHTTQEEIMRHAAFEVSVATSEERPE
ncbi:MAG TPA: sugar ABC transporter ATP-binding protein [Bryobacteraceae bacterium]|nr:sugar ABC transporter ATP-binding protein [Bryobacteraceae bacterium]